MTGASSLLYASGFGILLSLTCALCTYLSIKKKKKLLLLFIEYYYFFLLIITGYWKGIDANRYQAVSDVWRGKSKLKYSFNDIYSAFFKVHLNPKNVFHFINSNSEIFPVLNITLVSYRDLSLQNAYKMMSIQDSFIIQLLVFTSM